MTWTSEGETTHLGLAVETEETVSYKEHWVLKTATKLQTLYNHVRCKGWVNTGYICVRCFARVIASMLLFNVGQLERGREQAYLLG